MSILRIKVEGNVYEIDVKENYLQERFGTFFNERTPFKMVRSNWDNSEFFDYQSKNVFSILVQSKKRTIQQRTPITEQEKRSVWSKIQENNRFKSSAEIDALTESTLESMERETEEKSFRMRYYCTITAFFLNGEWHFKTEYSENDIRRSLKREITMNVLTSYPYTGEELGVFDNVPDEDIFAKLF